MRYHVLIFCISLSVCQSYRNSDVVRGRGFAAPPNKLTGVQNGGTLVESVDPYRHREYKSYRRDASDYLYSGHRSHNEENTGFYQTERPESGYVLWPNDNQNALYVEGNGEQVSKRQSNTGQLSTYQSSMVSDTSLQGLNQWGEIGGETGYTYQQNDMQQSETGFDQYSQYETGVKQDIYSQYVQEYRKKQAIIDQLTNLYVIRNNKAVLKRKASSYAQTGEQKDSFKSTSRGFPTGKLSMWDKLTSQQARPTLSTDQWLEYRTKVAPNTEYRTKVAPNTEYRTKVAPNTEYRTKVAPNTEYGTKMAPDTQYRTDPSLNKQVDNDIITLDNMYRFVKKPRGPDVFTVNVESALNF